MTPNDTPTVPAPDDHAPLACLNCEASLTGAFCAQCGQSAATHRFTLAHLLHEIPHSIWHVDRGLPYTLKEMLVRPGHTIRRYLAGQRVDLFRPVALVLLLAGAASFLLLLLHIEQLEPNRAAVTAAGQEAIAANHLVFKYFAWFTIAMLPLYSLLSWVLLRRLRYNFVEHLMANALVIGGVLAVQILFLPLLAWARHSPWLKTLYLIDTFLLPVYQMWAFTLLALGAYRLAGSLWRGFIIAFIGLLGNSLLLNLLSLWLVRLTH
ncbi:DUF3667 domain-containing protein [Hymenobacter algoricola]|uniref:DUF3667 domain-containing protein n=1 Tax=Hymenobacter algoricola TaxID=486267 RepID=A0ABP7MMC6_9BACT